MLLYASRPRRTGLTKERAKAWMLDMIEVSNKTIYTALVNVNDENHRWSYVAMFMVIDGEPVNISYYAAFIADGETINGAYTEMKCKEGVTDYVRCKTGTDVGKWAVKTMQYALYQGMMMKERLIHKWI